MYKNGYATTGRWECHPHQGKRERRHPIHRKEGLPPHHRNRHRHHHHDRRKRTERAGPRHGGIGVKREGQEAVGAHGGMAEECGIAKRHHGRGRRQLQRQRPLQRRRRPLQQQPQLQIPLRRRRGRLQMLTACITPRQGSDRRRWECRHRRPRYRDGGHQPYTPS